MPTIEVAEHVRRGQLEEATRICLDDYAVDITAGLPSEVRSAAAELLALAQEQLAMGHARELVWIAAAYAKQGDWERAAALAWKSYETYQPQPKTNGDLYVRLLLLAGKSADPDCATSRLVLESSVFARIEDDMRQAVASAQEQGTGRTTAEDKSKKKDKCFIATAAYGSAFAPDVVALRRFRDTRLKQNWLGRWVIRIYEQWSPPLADAIASHPTVRLWVRRLVLSPVVWLVRRWTS
jgi:hypothetical protein